jgi:ribosome biogenesis GTPase
VLQNNNIILCSARGNIKLQTDLKVGDFVKIENDTQTNSNIITNVMERKNNLIRPYIANIDQLFIVISSVPKPDFLLVDKLIIGCIIHNIEPIIVVNKAYIIDKEFFNDVVNQYTNSVKQIILTSTYSKTGYNNLIKLLENKLTVFCGQSAVGKTSLINMLFGQDLLKTGELSKKIMIGKNTTRESQIFVLNNNTLIADTPGFNMLNIEEIKPNELKNFYLEFNEFNNLCYYYNCNHVNNCDDKCAVINAVNNKEINEKRYSRYLELYKKLETIWRNKYD